MVTDSLTMGTIKTEELSSPHNELAYSSVRYKEVLVKVRQNFIAFAVSLGGQELKFFLIFFGY